MDDIKAEFVLINDTINAFISGPACNLASTIAHLFHQFNNQALKEARRLVQHPFKKLPGKALLYLVECAFQDFIRSVLFCQLLFLLGMGGSLLFLIGSASCLEIAETLVSC